MCENISKETNNTLISVAKDVFDKWRHLVKYN